MTRGGRSGLRIGGLSATFLVLATGVLAASPQGYGLSYGRSPGLTSDPSVDLVSLSSTDTGGAAITVTFSVSGTLALQNTEEYSYSVYFGGAYQSSATAHADFGPTVGGWTSTLPGEGGPHQIPYSVSPDGSALTFAINKSAVGPLASFSIDVYAEFSTTTPPGNTIMSALGTHCPHGVAYPTPCVLPIVLNPSGNSSGLLPVAAPALAVAAIGGGILVVVVGIVVVWRRRAKARDRGPGRGRPPSKSVVGRG